MRGADDSEGTGRGPGSLDALYRRHAAWLRRILRRRFGGAVALDAEDLVQEAYLRLAPYQAAGVVRHPRALLLQVATNLARDQLRRTARGGGVSAQIEDVIETEEHGVPADQVAAVLLKQIVAALPPPLRDVFVLSRFAGMTNQDIASRCGLAVKTVEWRMTRALVLVALQLRN